MVLRDHPAAAFLDSAYPAGRQRVRAIRSLAWIAAQMGSSPDLAWWKIPGWIGERKLRTIRLWTGTLTLAVAFGVGWSPFGAQYDGAAALSAAVFGGLVGGKITAGGLRRASVPFAMAPRRPRSGREVVVLATASVTGVLVRAAWLRLWVRDVTDDPAATAESTYQACRRSTVIDGLACVLTGLPVALLALVLGRAMLALGAVLTGLAYLLALADGKLPAVKLTELYLLLRWRPVNFRRLLCHAAERDVLRRDGVYYRFRDPSLQEYLVIVHRAGEEARARRIPDAVAAATTGVRPWLLGLLSKDALRRVATDLACGAGAATAAGFALAAATRPPGGNVVGNAILALFVVAVAALVALIAAVLLMMLLVRVTRWSLWVTSRMSRQVRVAVAVGVAGFAGVVTLLAGPVAMRHGIAVLFVALVPAGLVAVVGGWACVLTHRRWHEARRCWQRHVADVLLAAVTCAAILLLARPDVLGVQATAGLLFPVSVWFSIRAWRAMTASGRRWVRAGADIAVSLLLGASLVALLVWLANLLHLPVAEAAVLRSALEHGGSVIDWPWWLWAGLFAMLAVLSLAFALRPERLKKAIAWSDRFRIVPSANALRRSLSGVHIGLLVVVLFGLAAPVAAGPVLQARLAATYTETLSADLRARGELTAYQQIHRQFSSDTLTAAQLAPLAVMVTQIDDISKPADPEHDATSVELDLAARIGQLQAVALALGPAPEVEPAEQAATRQAGFDTPVRDADDMSERIAELDHRKEEKDAMAEQVDRFAELAVSAVANVLSIPRIGNSEVVQIIREYLSSLIEESPLKDIFAGWAGRLTSKDTRPVAAEMVVPDPQRLKDAASVSAARELVTVPVTDPEALRRFLGETAIVAAVDLANQVRYLQEGNGPCRGCAKPVSSQDEHGGSDYHPDVPDAGF